MEKLPPFKIHSNKGAAQFYLQPAYFAGETYQTASKETVKVLEPGFVMVEAASFLKREGRTASYDWRNKVVMKLSPKDLVQIIQGLEQRQKVTLEHFRENGSGKLKSFLNIFPGEKYGFCLQLCFGEKKPYVQITTDADAEVLKALLQRAVVRSVGW